MDRTLPSIYSENWADIYCAGEIDEPLKVDELYATNAVVTILVKDLWTLLNISFNFAPAGMEIIKPEKEYYLKHNDLQAIMINIAQISAQFSEYILGNVLSKDDYEKVKKDIARREELGKKLIGENKKTD